MTLYSRIPSEITTVKSFPSGVRVGQYRLPPSDGSNNNVLVTNGTGTLSWMNPGAATDASLIASGTLSDSRLSSNIALRNAANAFTANVASTSTTTGTLVITGGVGVSGKVNAGTVDATTFTGEFVGNASTATTLQTGRTISLTGAVSGTSSAFDGSIDISFTTTLATVGITKGGTGATSSSGARTNLGLAINTDVQGYSADLKAIADLTYTSAGFLKKTGTSTWTFDTNNYLTATEVTAQARNAMAAGTGIAYDPSTGTISIGQAIGTSSDVSFNNLTVAGNLTVNGTTTTVNSTVSTIKDPVLDIGGGTGGAAPTTDDGKDRGVLFQYYATTAKKGFFGFDASQSLLTFVPDASVSTEVISGNAGNIRAANYLFEYSAGDVSKSVTLAAPTGMASGYTVTLPNAAGTLVKSSDTFNLGTTSIPLNASSAAIGLTGISSIAFPSGSFITTLRGSPNATNSWQLTLPTTAGSSGQVLQTDGTGLLTWSDGSATMLANVNTWTANQKFNYITLIEQSSTPSAPLDGEIKFYTKTDGLLYYRANSGGAETVFSSGGSGGGGDGYLVTAQGLSVSTGSGYFATPMGLAVSLGGGSGTTSSTNALLVNNLAAEPGVGTDWPGKNLNLSGGAGTGSGIGGDIIFKTAPAGSTGTTENTAIERARITQAGLVGIATSSPTALLHINGTSATTPFMAVGSATKNLSYAIENSTENTLKIFSTTGKSKLSFISPNGQSNTIAFSGYDSGTSTSTVHTTITESDAGMSINFTKDIGASGTYVGSQLPPFAIKSGSTNLIYTGQKDINADHTYGGYYTGLDAIILGTTAKTVYADTLPAYGEGLGVPVIIDSSLFVGTNANSSPAGLVVNGGIEVINRLPTATENNDTKLWYGGNGYGSHTLYLTNLYESTDINLQFGLFDINNNIRTDTMAKISFQGNYGISSAASLGFLSQSYSASTGNIFSIGSGSRKLITIQNDSPYNVILGNNDYTASPNTIYIRGTNGLGTNISGGNLLFYGGRSTGTGTGGSITFSPGLTGSTSGTTINSVTPKFTIQNSGVKITNGTGNVILNASATTGTVTYTLPTADGTLGQTLTTDGAGNLNWSTSASTGSGGTFARSFLFMG